ncbi:hypothetical protein BGW36DRAFT_305288 [Talaromyces proteolyticus]|uniref:Protein HRI1 n=1 Tax=Talaromyces proteolyticus TaxID=1131652 RepID=A0AAD4KJD0_9EURO|nr:uncharacterized protein BGW36DRAFT_305288 [Talaromyces proteolyticus]KAH8691608.1 hypothetical protein BGW36DRAFT_305288 [Talaromyces proteolyticus]
MMVHSNPIQTQTLTTGKHAYSMSTRVSIRWPPEDAYENTDTTVLSVNNFFVDLRVEKDTKKLDWAIAGVRVVDQTDSRRVTFLHTINSRNTFQHVDTGLFTPMDNGDELETGTMLRPSDPAGPFPRQYEEVWRQRKPIATPGPNIAYVLESAGSHVSVIQNMDGAGTEESKEVETFLARIGGTYIAVRQPTRIVQTPKNTGYTFQKFGDTEGVSVRHEEYAGKRGWVEKYSTGPESKDLPSMVRGKNDFTAAQEGKNNWRKPGQRVFVRGEEYVVRGFTDMS